MVNHRKGFEEYKAGRRRSRYAVVALFFMAFILFALTIGISTFDRMSYLEILHFLFDRLMGGAIVDNDQRVVWDLLVPRALGALIVGGALGIGGAVMQIILRNPLADPYTTGISSGAGLGAIAAIVLGFSLLPGLTGQSAIIVNAFLFSLIPTALILGISSLKKPVPTDMILIGIGLLFFFSSATTVIMLMAEPLELQRAYIWGLGNLGALRWADLPLLLAMVILGTVVLISYAGSLNILSTDDDTALSLGVDPDAQRAKSLVVVSLLTASVVAFTGTIGFVGLVAPHVVRLLTGSDARYLLPSSFAVGAIMLLIADAAAKLLILPVGVMTSVIGGPVFLALLIKQRRRDFQ